MIHGIILPIAGITDPGTGASAGHGAGVAAGIPVGMTLGTMEAGTAEVGMVAGTAEAGDIITTITDIIAVMDEMREDHQQDILVHAVMLHPIDIAREEQRAAVHPADTMLHAVHHVIHQ